MKVFAVYDQAIKSFATPFYMAMEGAAVRAFQDMVNSKEENNISLHPEQFTLFYMGEYDDQTGMFTQDNAPKSLGVGTQYKDAEVVADKADLAMIHERIDELAKLYGELK